MGLSAGALAAGFAGWKLTPGRFFGRSYVQLGTSITGGAGYPLGNTTPFHVGQQLHLKATNAGLDGACAARSNQPALDRRSLHALVDAIISSHWEAQSTEDFPRCKEAIERLQQVDFRDLSYLGIEYGANDYRLARPVGRNGDREPDTFIGALNYSLARLSSAYPRLNIFLIAPAWRQNEDGSDTSTEPNSAGVFLREFVDATLQVGRAHGLPCLNMSRDLGIGPDNHKEYLLDGVHPNIAGAKLRGDVIAAFMKSVF
ncbi:SGNH/GDSL hydrolase family protein [Bradyrhizobium cenepequi]